MKPIGVIRTPFTEKEGAPIQGSFHPEITGTVEVLAEYIEGLKDIELFSHIFLFYYFDKAGEIRLVRPTFLDDEPHGVFASRHPCRPNGLGMTIVRLVKREGAVLTVSGIDVLDKTPLIDIKPYVPKFDSYPDASEGWIAGKENRSKPTNRE